MAHHVESDITVIIVSMTTTIDIDYLLIVPDEFPALFVESRNGEIKPSSPSHCRTMYVLFICITCLNTFNAAFNFTINCNRNSFASKDSDNDI